MMNAHNKKTIITLLPEDKERRTDSKTEIQIRRNEGNKKRRKEGTKEGTKEIGSKEGREYERTEGRNERRKETRNMR